MKNSTISRRTVLRAGGCALAAAPGVARMASASAETGVRSKSQVAGTDNEAFVMYVCHTANGKTFQNLEYFQFRKEKVRAIECYFGDKSSFPSAVSTGKG
jgi:hypothetical protein